VHLQFINCNICKLLGETTCVANNSIVTKVKKCVTTSYVPREKYKTSISSSVFKVTVPNVVFQNYNFAFMKLTPRTRIRFHGVD
jgi:hypothetical protein